MTTIKITEEQAIAALELQVLELEALQAQQEIMLTLAKNRIDAIKELASVLEKSVEESQPKKDPGHDLFMSTISTSLNELLDEMTKTV